MEERLQFEAREVARQLLLSFRESHQQWQDDCTPVEEISAWLGLEVETFNAKDQPEGTFGFLEPGEKLIWLRRDLNATLRRFTLAHELGHAVLHRTASPQVSREDPCQVSDVREEVSGPIFQEQADEVLGPGVAYDPRSQRELSANIFAAELLMPLERVRALYIAREVDPSKLAGTFQVSQTAMLNRLVDVIMRERDDISVPNDIREQGGTSQHQQYDEFQWAAIEAPTPALIVAGPGSGKTSTLIGRAAYLMHNQGIKPEHILALTFSRKAAAEMQERLEKMLASNMTTPSVSLALPTVSTFHAFCAELLRRHGELVGLRPGFAFIDNAEGYFLLRRMAGELPLHHYQNLFNPAAYFPDMLSAFSRAKDELRTPAMYRQLAQAMLAEAQDAKQQEQAEKALEIAAIYELYQQRLEQQGDTDFGGLIMLAVQLLQEHAEVREELHEQYQHILVDEFQDINRASGVLLRLLAGVEQRVWVVGDANQAIYGFRGASPANIANFRKDYPGAVVLPLSRNYRSRPDIVNIADAFRRNHLEAETQPGAIQTARSTLAEPYITLANAPDEASEFNGIINDMRRKHEQGYDYRDMVVLCRTRSLARKITRALVAADLPVIERGGLLEQQHIRNLLSVVMLLTDSSDMGILRAARLSDHQFSQQDVEILLQAVHDERANGQKRTLKKLFLQNDAPPMLSIQGRQSFTHLSEILNDLLRPSNTNSVWALLARYLFMETSIGRELLAASASGGGQVDRENLAAVQPPCHTQEQADALRADYSSLLQLARFYDQQQQTLRQQRVQQAKERGEEPEAEAGIQERAKGFLDYVTVLLSLRQDGGNRRESEADNGEEVPDVIRVMTVHASKGLEFPVVYLPGIANSRFPASKRWLPAPPPRGMVTAGDSDDSAHEIEEACLFYVGTTRARDHLVISHADRYGKRNYKRATYIDALLAGVSDDRAIRITWPESVEHLPAESEDEDSDTSVSSQPDERFIAAMKPETLRSSDIETYQRCPRQYLYGTIYGFRSDAAAYQLFRRATGETLDELQKQFAALQDVENGEAHYPTAQEVRELYSQHWREHDGHILPFGTMYEEHGHEVAELLRRKLTESGDTHWQLHPTYTVEVAGKTIEITIDRVEAPAQAGEPVKFVKTGFGRRKDKIDPSTRELLYAHASRQHHPAQPVELHFHNMSTGETFEITLKEKKEQKLYEELLQTIAGMERGEFPAKPDARICPGCAFFLICPA
ncbi:MAG TPA: UvrD-helicase domain-containing protein [Ktedonobacteraceae bacterium]|nr:UvrD-helicase domain-containing protein [Ktedonobacteraceae bacterium]